MQAVLSFNIIVMATYRELVYFCLDKLKLSSEDSFYNEEHIKFLLNKYRGALFFKYYKNQKKEIPESNYQTICLDLGETSYGICGIGEYLRSKDKLPDLYPLGINKVHPVDYFSGSISLISKDRFKYAGNNRWASNTIFATIGPENYLYIKSNNAQYRHLKKVYLTGLFENPEDVINLESNNKGNNCVDIMDMVFPIEEDLIPELLNMIVQDLSPSVYAPEDKKNDANDNLPEYNVKSAKR